MSADEVVLLRAGEDAGALAAGLAARGWSVATLRVADVVDVADDLVCQAVGDLASAAWVAVTSRQAARRLAMWSSRWPVGTRVAAVGPATADAVRESGAPCDAVAPDGTAASLATCIDRGPVLFLAGRRARGDLVALLGARGIEVRTVVTYDTVPVAPSPADLGRLARSAAVVAMSPSAIDAVLDAEGGRDALGRGVVAIGPTTADHARGLGLVVRAAAWRRDPAAIADALAAAIGTQGEK